MERVPQFPGGSDATRGKTEISRELDEAYASAREAGWYAGEGEPVRPETYEEARRFLDALPEPLLPTEVLPDPSGDLTFEWYENKDRVVLVSFDGTQRAIFALRFSEDEKASGQAPFRGEVPNMILYLLRRFCSLDERRE
jgi:hypothetical protein